MRRDQLEHAIRAACQIARQLEVIIVGSQAILGTYPEDELPRLATRSLEIDVLPITDDNNETIRLADLIVGAAGEFSAFEQLHGFSIDGVDAAHGQRAVATFASDKRGAGARSRQRSGDTDRGATSSDEHGLKPHRQGAVLLRSVPLSH